MQKIEIAKELLKNSKNIYLKDFIMTYIKNIKKINRKSLDFDLLWFDKCVSYFQREKFDVSNWELSEMPVERVFYFWNDCLKQVFDLCISDTGEFIPEYTDENGDTKQAKTIQEAIENFSKNFM